MSDLGMIQIAGKPFQPVCEDGIVRIYVCGPTVYSDAHMGHARTYVIADTIRRTLQDVFRLPTRFVINITDIDDKIIARAHAEKTDWATLARKYELEFWRDMDALHVLRPDVSPHVSKHIPSIIQLIQTLRERGVAYELPGSGMYFDTQAFIQRGFRYPDVLHEEDKERKLIPHDPEEDENKQDIGKKHPADFVLWKLAKPGEPAWETSLGSGRPGWHSECVAMINNTLGHIVDIHMGGIDLAFPHHTNEVAQAQAFLDRREWVHHWLHVGHLNIAGQKMSKSLKNFTTIRQALDKYTASQLRLFFLRQTPWAHTQDVTELALLEAVEADTYLRDSLLILENAFSHDEVLSCTSSTSSTSSPDDSAIHAALEHARKTIEQALRHSFDFVTALDSLQRLLQQARRFVCSGRTSVSAVTMNVGVCAWLIASAWHPRHRVAFGNAVAQSVECC